MKKSKILTSLAVTATVITPIIIATSCNKNTAAYQISINEADKIKRSQMRDSQEYSFTFTLNKELEQGVELNAVVIPTYETILKITKQAVLKVTGTTVVLTFSAMADSLTTAGSSTDFSVQFTFTKDNTIIQQTLIKDFKFIQQPDPIYDNVVWKSKSAVTKAGETTVAFGFELKKVNLKDKVTVSLKSQKGAPITIISQGYDPKPNWGGITVKMLVDDIYTACENTFTVTVTCTGYNDWSEDITDIHVAFTPALADIPVDRLEVEAIETGSAYSISGIKLDSNEETLKYCKRLVIPARIDGKPVKQIKNAAFYNYFSAGGKLPRIEEVVFAEDGFLTQIGDYAFDNCNSLVKPITIPNTVTYIGENAFHATHITGLSFAPGNETENLSIEKYAFKDCTHITGNLTIVKRISKVGIQAFFNCSAINGTLTISNYQTALDSAAFADCKSVSCINVEGVLQQPSNWTEYNEASSIVGCFDKVGTNNTTLSLVVCNVDLGSYFLEKIQKCSKDPLHLSINIFTSWDDFNYSNDNYITGLKEQTFAPEKRVLYIPSKRFINGQGVDIKGISDNAFYNTTSGASLVPAQLTELGFASDSQIEYIGKNAFRAGQFKDQHNIGFLYLPDSITTIGAHAFSEALFVPSLDAAPVALHLPNSLIEVQEGAFAATVTTAKQDKNFYIDGEKLSKSLKTVASNAFKGCVYKNNRIYIPKTLTEVGDNAFDMYRSTDSLKINYIDFSEWLTTPEWTGKNVFGSELSRSGIIEVQDITKLGQYNEWDQFKYQEAFKKYLPDIGLNIDNFSMIPTTMSKSPVKIDENGVITGFATYGDGTAVSMDDMLAVAKKKSFRGRTYTHVNIPEQTYAGKDVVKINANALDSSKLLLDIKFDAITFPSTMTKFEDNCILGQTSIEILDFTRLTPKQFMNIEFSSKSLIIKEGGGVRYIVVSSTWSQDEVKQAQEKINKALGSDKYWMVASYKA